MMVYAQDWIGEIHGLQGPGAKVAIWNGGSSFHLSGADCYSTYAYYPTHYILIKDPV